MSSRLFARSAGAAALFSLMAGGCMVFDAKRQMEQIDTACLFSGSVTSARTQAHSIIVVLFRRMEGQAPGAWPWQVVDHFVMERAGKWEFIIGKPGGAYAAAAFEDINDDLVYQPGEPYGRVAADNPIVCAPGGRYTDLAIAIPLKVSAPFPQALDVQALQLRSADAQLGMTLGQRTAVGEVVALSDPRFKLEVAENSLWRPLDFVMNSRPGVYFLEPYDRRKIPVLFVHGINGSPANFTSLIEGLDRSRFQPWVYYYPSGVHLAAIADLLNQTMAKLEARYDFNRFAVVAHSMGGLVSRGFILRNVRSASSNRIPLYVTMSTPWEGHKAAEIGIKYSPAVVRVWEDMVPGSAYQKSLFASMLPRGTAYHLVFTFKGSASGESGDGVVTVASQLYPQAQQEAARLYGFNDTHDGVLSDKDASALLNELLARSF